MGTPLLPDLRRRLAAGEFLLGTWVTLLDPAVAELLSGSGFDFLVVDGEHGPHATADLQATLIATKASGVAVLARVGANEPVRIMHALDAGATGVVVPQARSVGDVERAVAWCRYPPAGLRGIAPRRAAEWGRRSAEYLAIANEAVVCCVQVETAEAMADLDAMLAVPGLDAVLIGPNDLAAALGHTGQLDHPDVEAAIARVLEGGRHTGVPVGIWAPNAPAAAIARREQGFAFVTIGADYVFLAAAADAAIRAVRAG